MALAAEGPEEALSSCRGSRAAGQRGGREADATRGRTTLFSCILFLRPELGTALGESVLLAKQPEVTTGSRELQLGAWQRSGGEAEVEEALEGEQSHPTVVLLPGHVAPACAAGLCRPRGTSARCRGRRPSPSEVQESGAARSEGGSRGSAWGSGAGRGATDARRQEDRPRLLHAGSLAGERRGCRCALCRCRAPCLRRFGKCRWSWWHGVLDAVLMCLSVLGWFLGVSAVGRRGRAVRA